MSVATDKEYLTIKETADLIGISVQAVYQRLEKDFKPYLKIENKKKLLNRAVLELFSKEKDSSGLTSDFKDVLKILENQLTEKDRQIAVKDKQIEDLNNRLAEAHQMATQAQQLHGAEKMLQLEDGKKKGLFARLFGKDENK